MFSYMSTTRYCSLNTHVLLLLNHLLMHPRFIIGQPCCTTQQTIVHLYHHHYSATMDPPQTSAPAQRQHTFHKCNTIQINYQGPFQYTSSQSALMRCSPPAAPSPPTSLLPQFNLLLLLLLPAQIIPSSPSASSKASLFVWPSLPPRKAFFIHCSFRMAFSFMWCTNAWSGIHNFCFFFVLFCFLLFLSIYYSCLLD